MQIEFHNPIRARNREIQVGCQRHHVRHKLIQTLVIHRCQQLRLGRLAVGSQYLQRPLLLLSGHQPVAEGLPLHLQLPVGHRTLYAHLVNIRLSLLHPCEGHLQAVAIFRFIGKLSVQQFVRQVHATLFHHRLSRQDGIDHMHILRRRAHLHRHGCSVARELRGRGIEPVVRLDGRTLVIEREHHEVVLQRIFATDGVYRIASALQLGQFYLLVRLHLLPFTLVQAIAQRGIHIGTSRIIQVESHLSALFRQHLLGHIHTQCRLSVAQGQHQLAMMRLTRLVSHIHRHQEVIIHRIVRLRQHHWRGHLKLALFIGFQFTLGQHIRRRSCANRTLSPIARVSPPPIGTFSHHLIFHLAALHRHTGIRTGSALHLQRVAVGIVVRHLGNVHLEGRTLVFLHREVVVMILHRDIETPCQSLARQGELRGAGTKVIRGHFLRGHLLAIGIVQRHLHRHTLANAVLIAILHLIQHRRCIDGLSRAIDGPVRHDGHMLQVAHIVIIVEPSQAIHPRAGLVVIRRHEYLIGPSSFGIKQALALVVSRHDDVLLVHLHRYRGILHGLSRCGVHHHIARHIVGQHLSHQAQAGDIVERASLVLGLRLTLKLQHIDAHGQGAQHQRVLKLLIGSLVSEGHRLCHLRHLHQSRLNLVVVLLRVQVVVLQFLGSSLYTIHTHLELRDAAQVLQLQEMGPVWQHDALTTHVKHTLLQVVLLVAQIVHALPRAPALQGILQIPPFFAYRGIRVFVHISVANDGHLARLFQVGIDISQRVEAVDLGRFAILHQVIVGLVVVNPPQTAQKSCHAVVGLQIVVPHHIIATSLATQQT